MRIPYKASYEKDKNRVESYRRQKAVTSIMSELNVWLLSEVTFVFSLFFVIHVSMSSLRKIGNETRCIVEVERRGMKKMGEGRKGKRIDYVM